MKEKNKHKVDFQIENNKKEMNLMWWCIIWTYLSIQLFKNKENHSPHASHLCYGSSTTSRTHTKKKSVSIEMTSCFFFHPLGSLLFHSTKKATKKKDWKKNISQKPKLSRNFIFYTYTFFSFFFSFFFVMQSLSGEL